MDTTIIVALINGAALIIGAYVLNRVRQDVRKVELATNSMKDALVKGAHREGVTEGKQIQKDANAAMG